MLIAKPELALFQTKIEGMCDNVTELREPVFDKVPKGFNATDVILATDNGLQRGFGDARNDFSVIAFALFEQAEGDGFAISTPAMFTAYPLGTDAGCVRFHLSGRQKTRKALLVHAFSNFFIQKKD